MDSVRTLSATASFDLLVSTREGADVLLTVAPHVAVRGDLTVEPTTAEDWALDFND